MVRIFQKLWSDNVISGAGKLLKPFSEIPGPKTFPFLGSMLNYIPIGDYNMERLHHTGKLKYKKYGKIIREEILPGMVYLFLYDPNDIQTMYRTEGKYPFRRSHTIIEHFRKVDTPEDHNSAGLLPSNGEDWSRFRLSFQQPLALENVRPFMPASDIIISEFVNRINDSSVGLKKTPDFLPHLLRLNMELLGEHFFGERLNAFTDVGRNSLPQRLIDAVEALNIDVMKEDHSVFRLWHLFKTPMYRKIKKNITLLESTAKSIISKRMANPQDESQARACILKTWLKDGKEKDIKDVVTMSADMFLAGIDTSSYTTGFLMYELSTHFEHQEKLFEELKTLIPKKDSPITPNTLLEATYLKRILKETLRLHPISIGVGRIMTANTDIGGYLIPAKTVVVTMNQVSCRLPEYFLRPDEFIPDRWAPENRKITKTHPFLVLPFGHGPRACIARRLAEQQILMFIARLCRNFQFEWNGSKALDCLSSNINRPDAPLLFKFTARQE